MTKTTRKVPLVAYVVANIFAKVTRFAANSMDACHGTL